MPRLTSCAVVALLVLSGCGGTDDKPPAARTSPSRAQQPVKAVPSPIAVTAPVVMMFGDSYTAGTSQTAPERTYAAQTGRRLGWQVIIGGRAGTGFLAKVGGRDFGALYADQLAWRPAPDMVLVSGGHNDVGRPAAAVAGAAQRLLTDMGRRWPGTHLVLMGPMFGGDAPRDGLRIRDALRGVAIRLRIRFIDPVDAQWITGDRRRGRGNAPKYVMRDGVHLNEAGAGYVADRLAEKLRDLGLAQPVQGRPPVTTRPSVVAKP